MMPTSSLATPQVVVVVDGGASSDGKLGIIENTKHVEITSILYCFVESWCRDIESCVAIG